MCVLNYYSVGVGTAFLEVLEIAKDIALLPNLGFGNIYSISFETLFNLYYPDLINV